MPTSSPFPYTYKEEYQSTTAVFKLWFGKRYFIYKGMKFKTTVENLAFQIHREIRTPKDDSILVNVIAYVKKGRITYMEVEKLFEADSHVDLLMFEYETLQEAKNDQNCLNTRFTNTDYYPNWIAQVAINEFVSRLQKPAISQKGKNLKKYLKKYIDNQEDLEDIMTYILERFK